MNKPSTLHALKKIKAMNNFIHSLPANGAKSYTFKDTYSADFLNIFYTEPCLREVIASPDVKTRLDLKLTKEKEDNSRTLIATESKKCNYHSSFTSSSDYSKRVVCYLTQAY